MTNLDRPHTAECILESGDPFALRELCVSLAGLQIDQRLSRKQIRTLHDHIYLGTPPRHLVNDLYHRCLNLPIEGANERIRAEREQTFMIWAESALDLVAGGATYGNAALCYADVLKVQKYLYP